MSDGLDKNTIINISKYGISLVFRQVETKLRINNNKIQKPGRELVVYHNKNIVVAVTQRISN